jgi:hypothetical protein
MFQRHIHLRVHGIGALAQWRPGIFYALVQSAKLWIVVSASGVAFSEMNQSGSWGNCISRVRTYVGAQHP